MTAPGSVSAPLVRGKVVRFTKVDECGMPQTTGASFVTEAVATVGSTKNVDAGNTINVRLMNGQVGVYEKGKPTVLDFTLDIELVEANPGLISILTDDAAVLGGTGGTDIVGFEELALVPLDGHFAMEVWADTAGTFCQAGSKLTGYMLYPHIYDAYFTIDNVSDAGISVHINGSSTGAPEWGKGPYEVVADPTTGDPSRLLVAVDARAHRHFELTSIAPPAPTTGPAPVTITLPTPY